MEVVLLRHHLVHRLEVPLLLRNRSSLFTRKGTNMKKKPSLKSFFKQSKGSTAVEFSLILPILMALSFGIFNFSEIIAGKNRLNMVLNAGLLYSIGISSDTTAVKSAMDAATSFSNITTQVQNVCRCSDNSIVTCGAANASCPDQKSPTQYIQLSGSVQITPLFGSFVGLGSLFTANNSITVRVR